MSFKQERQHDVAKCSPRRNAGCGTPPDIIVEALPSTHQRHTTPNMSVISSNTIARHASSALAKSPFILKPIVASSLPVSHYFQHRPTASQAVRPKRRESRQSDTPYAKSQLAEYISDNVLQRTSVQRRNFSKTTIRARDHHFDTLKFVQRLKDEKFSEEQAVAMMKILSDVIEER